MPAIPAITVANNIDGTCTVTVTGSTVGTTNTVKTLRVDSAWPGVSWVTQSPNRSGDGTIDLTLAAGVYFFVVTSDDGVTTVWSPPVMGHVSATGESIYRQIISAVVTRIRLLSLDGVNSANVQEHPVLTLQRVWEVRKESVIVGPFEQAIAQFGEGGNSTNHFGYPVGIGLVGIGNRDEDTHVNRWLLSTERVRNAFVDVPLQVSSGCVFTADYVPMPVYDKEWWSRNAFTAFVGLQFRTSEQKGMS